MVTLIGGLVGGLVATIVMTILMMTLGDDSPPPPSAVWAKYIGDAGPEEYMMQGMVVHILYGIIAGGVFALIVPLLGFVSVATLGAAVLWGLVYAIVLFIGGVVFWMKIVLGMDADMRMAGMFLLFHLTYGAVLGAWVGLDIL